MAIEPVHFTEPLVEGVVQARKSAFIMTVKLGDDVMECRSPTTWHIGDLEVAGRPCLLSRNEGTGHKTPFTVEAVSLDGPEAAEKKWIGINLTAADRYFGYYLERGGFPEMVNPKAMIRRERLSGKANLDFVAGSAAIAIKAQLVALGLDVPEEMRVKERRTFPSTKRFIERIASLRKNAPSKRVILVFVHLYDRPDVSFSEHGDHHDAVVPVLESIRALKLEVWQANFIVTEESVRLDRYAPLNLTK